MNDLVVNSHLGTIVVDDEDADAATAVVERLGETLEKVALVNDGKTLLDVTSLSHGDNATVLADVKNTVLLEDRTKHVLDNDGRGRVGDEAGLLMELLGEEVDTEVTVLASLGGGGDADDLARASLEDQEIANADVVARDGNGVGRSHLAGGDGLAAGERRRTDGRTVGGCGSRSWGGSAGSWGRSAGSRDVSLAEVGRGRGSRRSRGGSRSGVLLLNNDVLADVLVVGRLGGVVVRVVVAVTVDGVSDVVGYFRSCLGDTVTKRVVLAVVVVISHITLVRFGGVNSGTSSFYSNLLAMRVAAVNGFYLTTRWVAVVLDVKGLSVIARSLVVVGLGVEVAALSNGSSDDGTSTLAELTLGDVNLGSRVVGLRRTLDSVEVAIVGALRCFEMATDDRTLGLIAVVRKEEVSLGREEKRADKWGGTCRSDNNTSDWVS